MTVDAKTLLTGARRSGPAMRDPHANRQDAERRRTLVDRDETVRMLEAISTAFDQHDLEGIMAHIADDAVFDGPRGTEPWGTRFTGSDAIREAFAARFAGIPDIRYQEDDHFVDGDRGASEWTLSGTTTEGQRIEVRGCDLWTFRDGAVVRKDSYWKIRTGQP
jgi:ketosteroid isomerase-like protein